MFAYIATIVVSFLALIYGAGYFVSGAASISRKLGISAFVVGLTVVAMGTSAPELFVNVIAALNGATDLSISNILGSNTADILLGLGIASLFATLQIKKGTVWKELPFAMLSAIILLVFGSDLLLDGAGPNLIDRSEGIALLGFFIIFIVYTFGLGSSEKEGKQEEIEVYSWTRSIVYIVLGVVGLVLGGKYAVSAAVGLATLVGLSQNLVGLTIVAAGTSLPEVVTAVIATRRGQLDMAVGGIVGTIIFNALFALGVTAVVRPLPFAEANTADALVSLVATMVLFFAMFVGKKHRLERWQGIIMILLYLGYLGFVVVRG